MLSVQYATIRGHAGSADATDTPAEVPTEASTAPPADAVTTASAQVTGGPRTRLIDRAQTLADRLSLLPPGATVTGALLIMTTLWAVLQQAEPFLGHDESVYAGRARSMLTGAPAVGWMIYRPVGLTYLGYAALAVGRPLGHDTVVLRLLGLLLALVTVGIVYLVASRVIAPRRAAVAVLVVISGATFLRRMPEFLDDVPAAGTLLLTAYLVLRSRRPGGRWALPAAGATGVVTVLLRYGAVAGLLSIACAAVLVWGPRVWLRAWREVAAAAAVSLLGLAPLAAHSYRETGSLIGVLVRAEEAAHRAYLGEGLAYYAQAYPAKLAGVLGAVVMAAGLVATGRSARRVLARTPEHEHEHDHERERDRERLFLGLAAVAELVLLGVIAHGESRFVIFTVFVLVVLGVDALAEAAGPRSRLVLAVTAVTAVPAAVLTAALLFHQMTTATAHVRSVASVAERARGEIATTAGVPPGTGASCLVVTRLPIEAGWASGCDATDPDEALRLPDDVTVYVLTFPGTPGWTGLDRVRALTPGRSWTAVPVSAPGQLGDAVVAVSGPVAPGGTAP